MRCIECGTSSYGQVVSVAMTVGTAIGRRLLRPTSVIAVSTAVKEALVPTVTAPIDVVPNFVGPEPPPVNVSTIWSRRSRA